jgi:eukaryotic-like serine/threonine-protein kinase
MGASVSGTLVLNDPADVGRVLDARWKERGIDPGTIKLHNGTAMATSSMRPVAKSESIAVLPLILEPAGGQAQFRVVGMLGEGGMGVVKLARQEALERDVALKSLRQEIDDERAVSALIREARVTGALEHPSIVPVYALGKGDDQRPLIVMKRIEGRSWADRLNAADPSRRLSDETLRQNLGILRQVALAVSFAHQKGVLHRDIKPDNVMIGSFGEVYLVDWGIAVSLREDGVRGLPLARDVCDVEGTPPYLAPEMAVGSGSDLDERSDVYLLGATLHEILTGQPPHGGATLLQMLQAAFLSAPQDYWPETPRALVAICHRAMARFAADRYPSAQAFVEAIDHYLETRAAMSLSDEAERRLGELVAVCAREDLSEAEHDRVHTLFTEVRFGFQHALKTAPDYAPARTGLQRALEAMIRFELGRGAADAANAFLRELPDPNPELAKEVAGDLAEARGAAARLSQLERDRDLSIGERERRKLTAALGVAWGVAYLGSGVASLVGALTVDLRLVATVIDLVMAVCVMLGRVIFPTLGVTEVNRNLIRTSAANFATLAAVGLVALQFDVELAAAMSISALAAMVSWTALAVTLDRNWLVMSSSMLIASVLCIAAPLHTFSIFGAIPMVGALIASKRWLKDKRAE